jgi:hypothetical protein
MKKPLPEINALTRKHTGIVRRITADIHLSQTFDPNNPPDPLPPKHPVVALWDTGATGSVLTQATIAVLGLVQTGVTTVTHAGGSVPNSPTYLANFYLPNAVEIAGVIVSQCHNIAGNFGAIIGMDIITLGDFAITNYDGKTWLSFRTPSSKAIDYVHEFNQSMKASIGRNEPCFCGKKVNHKPVKFKHCHGKGL